MLLEHHASVVTTLIPFVWLKHFVRSSLGLRIQRSTNSFILKCQSSPLHPTKSHHSVDRRAKLFSDLSVLQFVAHVPVDADQARGIKRLLLQTDARLEFDCEWTEGSSGELIGLYSEALTLRIQQYIISAYNSIFDAL